MKKVTITNAYTWYNKGDAGILLGIVETLKKVYDNNVEFTILSFTPEEDKKRYCKDKCIKNVFSATLNPFPYKNTKIGKVSKIIRLFFRMCNLYFQSKISLKNLVKKEESFKILSESDLIVVCGGGFLGGKKYDSLMHLFQIYVDTIFKKPVIAMGTSIEPIKRKLIKRYTEKVLKRVNYVYAREKITYQYLSTFLEKSKYTLIPDMAFMLGEHEYCPKIIKNLKVKEKKLLIGVTVRKWNFPNANISKEIEMDNYKKSIATMMEKYINEKGAYFVYIPQVIAKTCNDTEVAMEIRELLPNDKKQNFIILRDDLSPMQIKGLIGNFDYFIGTRMHSNIFATSMGVPTVAIAYEKKTNGIMQTVGLSNYVVEIDDITPEKLINKIEQMVLNTEDIRRNLEKIINGIRKDIIEKISLILKNM